MSAAFGSMKTLMYYLEAREFGDWRIRLVARNTFFPLIADLHASGCRGLCYEPNPDGSGGTAIPLADLMELVTPD